MTNSFDPKAYASKYYKARYERRKAERLCVDCGKALPKAWEKVTCPKCSKKRSAMCKAYYERYIKKDPKLKPISIYKAKQLLEQYYARAVSMNTSRNPIVVALEEVIKEVTNREEAIKSSKQGRWIVK